MEIVDLTRPMTHETLVALGGRRVVEGWHTTDVVLTWQRHWSKGDNGAQGHWALGDHWGTHVDAPIHIVRDAPGVDEMDLTRLMGEAVVLDCRFATGRGLTSVDFERARPEVRPGDIVLICSDEPPGTIDVFVERQTYVTPDGAEWLVRKGVKAVGVEPSGFEHVYRRAVVEQCYRPEVENPWPAHRVCLEANVYVIEGLTNLVAIVGERVNFAALPLPVPGSSGSPVRAVAWRN
jgi:kynurenine formamidase